MTLENFTLKEFLLKNGATNFRSTLPLVHTTAAANTAAILNSLRIQVESCDVFKDEKLAYFFAGRPAYKLNNADNPAPWQLPLVLVLKQSCLVTAKRIFPFDSGAFSNKIMSPSITGFNMEGFQIAEVENAIDAIINLFFGSDNDYYTGNAFDQNSMPKRLKIDMENQQTLALSWAYRDVKSRADDRRLAVEIQSAEDVDFQDNLLGVVLPRPFFNSEPIKNRLKEIGAAAKYYDLYPSDIDSYYLLIYDKVRELYVENGILDA